jgi:glycosyltransferase involved in cell wall biosynthesis
MDSTRDIFESHKCCIIIPTYNNRATLAGVIGDALLHTSRIIVINDGSTDGTAEVLERFKDIDVLENKVNRGKGYSLRRAFRFALDKGYDYAITIDSDGQHLVRNLPAFLVKSIQHPDALIIGSRDMNVDNVPLKSSVGKRFSNFWITVMTGLKLSDTQSGFRLYPIRKLAGTRYLSTRFEFEVEVIVRSVWKGLEVETVPVEVYYAPEGERISHYRPFVDFMRISLLNVLLVTLSLFVFWPKKALGPYRNKSIRQLIHDEIYMATGSNLKIALAVGFGVFMGIVPIWGYQLLVGFTLAHLFRLNKAIFFVAANISIPPMIPVILFASFYTGGLLLGEGGLHSFSMRDITFDLAFTYLKQYLLGAIVFAVISGSTAFIIGYSLLSAWRKEK